MSEKLKNINWPDDGCYRSGTEYEPLLFYLSALSNSNRFDLMLGYFSSAAISILSLGFAKFLSNGGKVRMIINNVLSDQDKDAISKGINDNYCSGPFDINDFKAIKKTLDEYSTHFFECFAWLISQKLIEIVIIKPKDSKGISHYKSGLFYDENNVVGFKGSCNFTAYGLIENLEELDVYLSWENGRSSKWIENNINYFNTIHNKEADFVEYIKVEDVEARITNEFGNKTLDELIIQECELLEKKKLLLNNEKYNLILSEIINQYNLEQRKPKFPYIEGPRDYQLKAYEHWVDNNYHGIFAMATGTGKTITALNCVLNEYIKTGKYQAIILVPTIVLVEQWEREALLFRFRNIIKASSKNSDWKANLDELKTQKLFNKQNSYIIISTYKTFTSKKFQDYISHEKEGTILIADEAHNIAAKNIKTKLPSIKISKKIALSATPKRIYDPEGSKEMELFFQDAEPYIVNYPMEKAIKNKILTEYYYYPKIVELNEEETTEYAELSLQIAKYYLIAEKDKTAKKHYEMLLMKRKSIIHKAKNKLAAFEKIIKELLQKRNGLKYLLVYAPEGYFADDLTIEDDYPELESDSRIIDYYSNLLISISSETTTSQYTSCTKNKDFILDSFEKGTIDVLLSMKCLDEGVDIPRTESAIFCSSTGNPRQFIQRRGRILRRHKDKSFSKIYDLIVIPRISSASTSFDIERKLVKKELERVVHFGFMAINKYAVIDELNEICSYYQLNLDTLNEELKNEE